MKTKSLVPQLAAILAAALISTQISHAVVLTSDPFSIAYGASSFAAFPATNTWTTTENSGVNTATAIGDFTFTPNVVGSTGSGVGVTFLNGVLANGTGTGPTGSQVGYTSFDYMTALNVTSTYTGVIPEGATNIQLTLYVTSLSVYGLGYGSGSDTSMVFNETTVGNIATSPSVTLNQTAAYGTAADYVLLDWNPNDVAVAGTSSTRTFNINGFTGGGTFVDGITFQGYVELSYDPVPEPSTLGFLTLGACALLTRCRVRTRRL